MAVVAAPVVSANHVRPTCIESQCAYLTTLFQSSDAKLRKASALSNRVATCAAISAAACIAAAAGEEEQSTTDRRLFELVQGLRSDHGADQLRSSSGSFNLLGDIDFSNIDSLSAGPAGPVSAASGALSVCDAAAATAIQSGRIFDGIKHIKRGNLDAQPAHVTSMAV